MKKQLLLISLFLTLILNHTTFGQVSPKRGIAYGAHTMQDMTAMKQGISWWYNWSDSPDPLLRDYYSSLGVEFVPMTWNANFNEADFIAKIKPGAKYLLGFNEPNLTVESNMSVQTVVNNWPRLERIAAAKNLEIVSAAAIYSGGGSVDYTDPVAWHRRFFELCPTCKVDYIAFHTYEGTAGGAIALTNNLTVFNRPVWVTEFADYHATTDVEERDYLQAVVSSYENNPDIFRYSWFTGRRSDAPRINLLGANGTLTALGTAYVNATYTSKKMNVPGRIVANKHYRRKGTGLENTSDGGTGQNIAYIDEGDWAEFMVNVSASGAHTMKFRVASLANAGKFDIQVNGRTVKADVTFAATGGWQTWVDVTVTGISLPQGEAYVKVLYKSSQFNFNYIDVTYEGPLVASADFTATPASSCIGNEITFTNQSFDLSGSETYEWNFGSNATPATATGTGPHKVTYSTGGLKSPSLTITNSAGADTETKSDLLTIASPVIGCLFSDEFDNAKSEWITSSPFTHSESGSTWTVSNAGYGEWVNFIYKFNNGTKDSPINFRCTAAKPLLKVRAKGSIAGKGVLTATIVDGVGRAIDNVPAIAMELGTSYKMYEVDFTGKFKNLYSPNNSGLVDSTNIIGIQFAVNPGYASQYPVVGASGTRYNTAYNGTIDIDFVSIGSNCNPLINGIDDYEFSSDSYDFFPNPFTNSAVFNVKSDVTEKVSIKILDVSGVLLYTSDTYYTNNDIMLGENLDKGVYTVLVNFGDKIKAFKIIKIN
jgi:PKD repeat protein